MQKIHLDMTTTNANKGKKSERINKVYQTIIDRPIIKNTIAGFIAGAGIPFALAGGPDFADLITGNSFNRGHVAVYEIGVALGTVGLVTSLLAGIIEQRSKLKIQQTQLKLE